MRDFLKRPGLSFLLAGTAALFFAGCEQADVNDPGNPGGVDIDVQRGESPDVDTTGPGIDVKTGEGTGSGVNVDIGREEGDAGAPDINIDIPERSDN